MLPYGSNAPDQLHSSPNKHNPPDGLVLPEVLRSEHTSTADAPTMPHDAWD